MKLPSSGSFFNYLMSNNSSIPVVGKGATIMSYTDRDVAEVMEVSPCGKIVVLESYNTTADRKEGQSLPMGHQCWKHELSGHRSTLVYKWNAWRVVHKKVELIGEWSARNLDPEMKEKIYQGNIFPQVAIEGYSKKVTEYHKIRILFGVLDYHYDWSF